MDLRSVLKPEGAPHRLWASWGMVEGGCPSLWFVLLHDYLPFKLMIGGEPRNTIS